MPEITPPLQLDISQTGTTLSVKWKGYAARFRFNYRESTPGELAWITQEAAAGGATDSAYPVLPPSSPVSGGGSISCTFAATLTLGKAYDLQLINLAADGTAFVEEKSWFMANDPVADFGVGKIDDFHVIRALKAEIIVGWRSTGLDRPYYVHLVEIDEFNSWRTVVRYEVPATNNQFTIPFPTAEKYVLYVAQLLYEKEGIVSESRYLDLCLCEDTAGDDITTTTTTFAPTTTTTTVEETTTTTTAAPTTTTTTASTTTTTTSSTTTTTTTEACPCPDGFLPRADLSGCYREETTPPTITSSQYCFAPSTLQNDYAWTGTKIFAPGYDVGLTTAFTLLTNQPQWRDVNLGVVGPFNRRGIWIDTDCDGTKDALTSGAVLTYTSLLVTTATRTVYVGVAGDNKFSVSLNGVLLAEKLAVGGGSPDLDAFRYWHVFPVDLVAGNNYINFSGQGDGSVNDAIAFAIYDNTAAELIAATADSDLTLLMDSVTLIGTTNKVTLATCPSGWFLDTSGGVGSYVCRRVVEEPCGGELL